MLLRSHQPCAKCGSSDALAEYDDGHHCFSCGDHEGGAQSERPSPSPTKEGPIIPLTAQLLAIQERGLMPTALAAYGVVRDGDCIYAPYYNEDGILVAAKARSVKDKRFWVTGDLRQATLFGQNRFPTGKHITVVEGEMDAIAYHQMTGYACVSVRAGAQGALKDCMAQYDYLNSFEDICINFDSDEVGQKAAAEVCLLFSGKARNLRLTQGKDANEYLVKGLAKDYDREWWAARAPRPDDIVNGNTLHDLVMQDCAIPITNYPWDGLNLTTYGIRRGEIVTVVAGSGSGKSTFVKAVLQHIHAKASFNLGVFALEESLQFSAQSLMSMAINKPLHLPTSDVLRTHVLNDPMNCIRKPYVADHISMEERERAYQETLASGRWYFYNSGGSLTVRAVMDRLRSMVKVDNCQVIVLDHISILVGMQQAQSRGNEREAIDECMHQLRSLVEETGVCILLVCHLSRGESGSTPHEEGGRAKLGQLRGSQGIAQLSNIVLALERNGQADNEEERNTTTVRVLKNRFSGETGVACHLRWYQHTGKLLEAEAIQ